MNKQNYDSSRRVSRCIELPWEIHDSWTELLSGCRLLLDTRENSSDDPISSVNLLRMTFVTSFQMVEVMFFRQLIHRVESQESKLIQALKCDLEKKISFRESLQKWPKIVMDKNLPNDKEPLQSLKSLRALRNQAIHHSAKAPEKDLGESVFFTAIEASKCIYEFFNDNAWVDSSYAGFCERYSPKSHKLLNHLLGEQVP